MILPPAERLRPGPEIVRGVYRYAAKQNPPRRMAFVGNCRSLAGERLRAGFATRLREVGQDCEVPTAGAFDNPAKLDEVKLFLENALKDAKGK